MTIKENLSLLDGLQQRVSHPRLAEPAPSAAELAECYKAAFRSPDHAWLRPWRFVECRASERELLGSLIADAMRNEQPDLAIAAEGKYREGPLRAPLVIICLANIEEHPKVPAIEQQIAAGCAAHNLMAALFALGYGAVWRTGDSAYSANVRAALQLTENQRIIGYLYVGSKVAEDKEIPQLAQQDFVCTLSEQLGKLPR